MVGTGDKRGDLCFMCRMSAQVHGYECLGDMGREGLGTIWGSCWGSCELAIQPPQPRCLSRTHPTTDSCIQYPPPASGSPPHPPPLTSRSGMQACIRPTTLTACSKSPIARYKPHLVQATLQRIHPPLLTGTRTPTRPNLPQQNSINL